MKVYIAQEICNESNPMDCLGETWVFDTLEKCQEYLNDCSDNEYSAYVMMDREVE